MFNSYSYPHISTSIKFPEKIINEHNHKLSAEEIVDSYSCLEKNFISKLFSRGSILFNNKLNIENNGVILVLDDINICYRIYILFKLNDEIFNESIDIDKLVYEKMIQEKNYDKLRDMVIKKISDRIASKLLSRLEIKI